MLLHEHRNYANTLNTPTTDMAYLPQLARLLEPFVFIPGLALMKFIAKYFLKQGFFKKKKKTEHYHRLIAFDQLDDLDGLFLLVNVVW